MGGARVSRPHRIAGEDKGGALAIRSVALCGRFGVGLGKPLPGVKSTLKHDRIPFPHGYLIKSPS